MRNEEIRNLIGGYATDTLTSRERQILYKAALEDQELFDALAEEQTLRDYLAEPASRARVAALLREAQPARAGWTAWWRPAAAVAFAAVVGVVVIREARPPAVQMARQAEPGVVRERASIERPAGPAAGSALPSVALTAPSNTSARMKVAVLDFASAGGAVPAEKKKEADAAGVALGKTASELLARNLDPNLYSVIDRKQIDAALVGQRFRERDMDAAAAANLGRQLGADAVIVGTVQSAPPAAPPAAQQAPEPARADEQMAKASVAAEQIEVRAEAINTQNMARMGSVQTQAPLNRAMGQAASSLNQQMRRNAAPRIEGQVTDVNATILTLNAGARAGVRVGDKLAIRRQGRVIGQVTINSTEDTFSVGTYEGPDTPRIGDAISNQP